MSKEKNYLNTLKNNSFLFDVNTDYLDKVSDIFPFRENGAAYGERTSTWKKNYFLIRPIVYRYDRYYLRKFENKSFDEAYSKFCKKVLPYEKSVFKENFEPKAYRSIYSGYYLDEDRIIRSNKQKREPLKFELKTKDYKEEKYFYVYKWGHNKPYKIVKEKDLEKQFLVRKEFAYVKVLSGSLLKYDANDYRVKRYKAEQIKEKRKIDREKKKIKENIVYQFLSKKEIKQKMDMQNNEVKIISHGFDLVTSFRK